VVEESGSWRSSVWLVNQAHPANLEFILGLGVAKSPFYLRLDWRSIVRFT
jgi:hypothetical protein